MKDDLKDRISDKLSYWGDCLTSDVINVTHEDMKKTYALRLIMFQIAIGICLFVTQPRHDSLFERICFALFCGFGGVIFFAFVIIFEAIIVALVNGRYSAITTIVVGIIGAILAFIFYYF